MPTLIDEIPSVGQLCHDLGYTGTVEGTRKYDLTESTKAWRLQYVSEEGIPGKDIRFWHSDNDNHDLITMAAEFLKNGYGMKHWPPGSGRELEYPRDEQR